MIKEFTLNEDIVMVIELLDGNKVEIPESSSAIDLAKSLSSQLAKKAIAAIVNDELRDITFPLKDSDKVKILTESDDEALEILRHSTAHLMAQAVVRLFPNTKVTIGPVIENGFFYDFDQKTPFTPDDLIKIEKEMKKISSETIPLVRTEISAKDAINKFSSEGENYKVEIINDLGVDTVSLYTQGDFTDLCRGVHVPSTNKIKHFKLLSVEIGRASCRERV